MSILSELKKLTGKQNAKVVSEALPDSTGGGGGALVVKSTVDGTTYTLDKTFAEIKTAVQNGGAYIVEEYTSENESSLSVFTITEVVNRKHRYVISAGRANNISTNVRRYLTDTENGYPSAD